MGGRKQRRENVCRILQAHRLSCPLLLRQHPPHRRAPQAQVPRNRRLTQALLRQRSNLCGIIGLGTWSPMGFPAFARVGNASFDPFADQVALKLSALLLDSRVVNLPRSSNLIVVTLSSLKPLFFNGLKKALRFSDNVEA